MDGMTALHWLEQVLGALLIIAVLVDIFLTVLYARTHIGIISDRVARLTWHTFMVVTPAFGKRRSHALSFLGPSVLLLIVIVWSLLLILGSAMIIHPNLGTGIKALHSETPTDFATALLIGGHSLTIASEANFSPENGPFRLFFLFTSIIGLIVTTLTLTYILHVYQALQERDALGLKVHMLSDETADASELIAGLGPHGHLERSYTELSEVAAEIVAAEEALHHYPVLFFFRFQEPYYSASSISLMALDTVSLIKSGLDDEEYGWLKESASIGQLWRAAQRLVHTMMEAFLDGAPEPPEEIDEQTKERWRDRYYAALRRLRQAGIKTNRDEEEGAESYILLRSRWDNMIASFAPTLGYSMEEIDPAGANPALPDEREEFAARLRSAD